IVVERERRDDNAYTDLETAASAPLRVGAGGELVEKLADRRQHAFLLDEDAGIAEAGGELERVDAVVVDDAIEVDVADVAFGGELGLHLEERAVEEGVGLAPEHGSAHFAGGRTDFAGE